MSGDHIGFKKDAQMAWASFNRQMFNPSIIKHNHFDAHIATAKNCGTHWIKYMLSHALSEIYDLPPPQNIRDNSIIGHPKNMPAYTNIPQIATTHSQPHYLMRFKTLNTLLKTPKCVFFVRNPKDLLVSIYEKWKNSDRKGNTQISFSQYLRVDMHERGFVDNIWGIIRFYNAWGATQAANKHQIMMVRYEDLKTDTHKHLNEICTFIGIENINSEIISNAIHKSSKRQMLENIATNAPQYDKIVNIQERNADDWYNKEDKEFLQMVCNRYLKYDFGYSGEIA